MTAVFFSSGAMEVQCPHQGAWKETRVKESWLIVSLNEVLSNSRTVWADAVKKVVLHGTTTDHKNATASIAVISLDHSQNGCNVLCFWSADELRSPHWAIAEVTIRLQSLWSLLRHSLMRRFCGSWLDKFQEWNQSWRAELRQRLDFEFQSSELQESKTKSQKSQSWPRVATRSWCASSWSCH